MDTTTLTNIQTSDNSGQAYLDLQGRLHLDGGKASSSEVRYVWVPCEQITFLQVFVPGKKTSEWQRALPYAIEESLGQPIEDLFIVLLRREPAGMTHVAVVEKTLMQLWIDELKAHHLPDAQLIPDCFRVTYQAASDGSTHWVLYRDETAQRAYLRNGETSGFSGSLNWMEQFLKAAASTNTAFQFSEVSRLPAVDFNTLKPYGLRQQQYQANTSQRSLLSLWRWPFVLLLAIMLISGLNSWLQTQKLEQQTQTYKLQTERLFKSLFPEVKRIVNIRVQTKSRLLQANQSDTKLDFVELLHKLDTWIVPLRTKGKLKILQAEWSNAQLTLKLEADSVETLSHLNQQINRQFRSQMTVSRASGNQIKGSIHVSQP